MTRPAERVEELLRDLDARELDPPAPGHRETVEAFGKAPRGFLSYGRDGRVFFIMTKENRARPDDLTRLTDAERAELYNTMVAYAGTFTFDGTVATCHVDVSWNEAWTGTAQVRHVKFEGDRLVWSTNPQSGVDGQRSQSVFVWEKLRGAM